MQKQEEMMDTFNYVKSQNIHTKMTLDKDNSLGPALWARVQCSRQVLRAQRARLCAWGLLLCALDLENLNNFISELVLRKCSLMGQRSMCVDREHTGS